MHVHVVPASMRSLNLPRRPPCCLSVSPRSARLPLLNGGSKSRSGPHEGVVHAPHERRGYRRGPDVRFRLLGSAIGEQQVSNGMLAERVEMAVSPFINGKMRSSAGMVVPLLPYSKSLHAVHETTVLVPNVFVTITQASMANLLEFSPLMNTELLFFVIRGLTLNVRDLLFSRGSWLKFCTSFSMASTIFSNVPASVQLARASTQFGLSSFMTAPPSPTHCPRSGPSSAAASRPCPQRSRPSDRRYPLRGRCAARRTP